MEQTLSRCTDLEAEIRHLVLQWLLGALVEALQALRGVALVIAVTLVAEQRFASPKQLMAFLGLMLREHSSGGSVRSRGISANNDHSIEKRWTDI